MFRGGYSFALLVLVLLLLLLLLCFTVSCKPIINQNCHIPPSSCGDIRNISFPFHLKIDPPSCGLPEYELVCENNQTIIYLNSEEYYVLSIDYKKYSMRILDPGIRKNHCSSFPLQPSFIEHLNDRTGSYIELGKNTNTMVAFISCPRQLESSLYVDTAASCNTENTSSNSNTSSYSYALVGDDNEIITGVEDSCMISAMAFVSSEFPIIDNTSFLSILDTMSNGFSLRWYRIYCGKCDSREKTCYLYCGAPIMMIHDNQIATRIYDGLWKIWKWPNVFWWSHLYDSSTLGGYYSGYPRLRHFRRMLALFVRFWCGLLCLFILIIYKYRRRHLSNDENIEHFLQGQQNLVPIRYSYSEIRKMTNKFKHKLGEGGYGSVFKGKLRSGIVVAVKMMNKSKASSGQDFINEVSTIGTIHHVNVVQLIGFCFEGSKRALVYEFMPNGSLEK